MRKILEVSKLSVGAWYDNREHVQTRHRPGPKPRHSDEEVLLALKAYLRDPDFYREGYKKIKVRLQERGILVGKERLRRIMGEHELLNNQANRTYPTREDHDGTIITEGPNEMWGMDIKEFSSRIGKVYFISAIDHWNSQIRGHEVSMRCTAKDAMHAIRNAVKNEFGGVHKNICKQYHLKLRVDHGTQFDSRAFGKEVKFLGIEKSSAFVRSPQSNGVIERFHRTLKEQLIDIYTVKNLKEAKTIINQFVEKYNQKWLLHKLGLKSPMDYQKYISSGNTESEGVRH